jgi:hypothetical protein
MANEDYKGYVEVREIKRFHIKAKTKGDAERILKLAINSMDEVIKLEGMKQGYEAEVSCLIARDWPSV